MNHTVFQDSLAFWNGPHSVEYFFLNKFTSSFHFVSKARASDSLGMLWQSLFLLFLGDGNI